MKRLAFIAVLSVIAASGPAFASGDASFAAALSAIGDREASCKAEVPAAPAVSEATRVGRYVSVSGNISLSGNGFVPGQNGGFATVSMTGWLTVRDVTGRITSNNTYVNKMVSLWVYPNQHVFQTVWLNEFVQLYRAGKPLGSTSVTGSVSVSGWPSGSSLWLNGSGSVSGTIYVEDEEG